MYIPIKTHQIVKFEWMLFILCILSLLINWLKKIDYSTWGRCSKETPHVIKEKNKREGRREGQRE